MGGIIDLPLPNAFIINSCSYHQIHSANTEGYPVNWFVYDANARNHVANQRRLDQNIVNLIEKELAVFIPFVQVIAQERCVQIWHVNEEKPDHINILNEHYEALYYSLFFPYGEDEDESLCYEAELYPEGVYLPASHTLSFRWSYKKTLDALA
ncbi:8091_t:CDS:2, partial [Gigaspora rosea]